MQMYKVLILIPLLTLAACAGLPAPKAFDHESSAIGISLNMHAHVKIFSVTPEVVFFVKLDKDDKPYNSTEVIQSNYAKDNQFYLLNAAPGRYAAVAAFYHTEKGNPNMPSQDSAFRHYFPKEVVEQSIVTVAPGTFQFMGHYRIETSVGFDSPDEAQLHYSKLLEPKGTVSLGKNILSAMLGGGMQASYTGTLKTSNRTKQAKEDFFEAAKKQLKDAGWSFIIDREINKLN